MALMLRSMAEAHEMIARARLAKQKFMQENKERLLSVAHTAEISVTAGGLGYANARWGKDGRPLSIGSVPVDGPLGIVLQGVVLLAGLEGEIAGHVKAVADGALAAYAYRYGNDHGRSAALAAAAHYAQAQGVQQPAATPAAPVPWWLASPPPPPQLPPQQPVPQQAPAPMPAAAATRNF